MTKVVGGTTPEGEPGGVGAIGGSPSAGLEPDAAALVALYDERVRLTHEMAASDHPTGAMAQEVLAAGRALDYACEAFRRRYFPRRAEVIVGLRIVMVCSKTRRNVESVYDAGLGAA
jgi:hypothetical protein